MTTVTDARASIYTRFKSGWGTYSPFEFENERGFIPPEDNETQPVWVRLSVRFSTGEQRTLGQEGNRKFGRSGLIIVQIFIPLGLGTEAADKAADKVLTVLEAASFDGVETYAGNPPRFLGQTDRWNQTNVEIPFSFEETK